MDGLTNFLAELSTNGIVADVWVNGSFLTEKVDPRDSDIVLGIHDNFFKTCTPIQNALLYKHFIADKAQLLKDKLCDAYLYFIYDQGSPLYWAGVWAQSDWIHQFGFDRGREIKGMAVISLPLQP